MRSKKPPTIVSLYLLAIALCACGQSNTNAPSKLDWSKLNSKERFHALVFTTPAYREEALRLVIEEANRVAKELHLPENLPITRTNLLEAYITPPRMAQGMRAIGNITTSNYTYYVSVGNKFSFLVRTHLEQEYNELKAQHLWPMSRMDTNAAYQLATQFLAAASMDVKGLNRDCNVHIRAFTPEGNTGKHFVPVYWVYWAAKGQEGHGTAASVELLAPTKTIRQMHVNESKYILRKPLEITNLDFLLSQTNAPVKANAPVMQ